MKDPLVDIDVNCKGVIHVLEAARRFAPDVMVVQIGTSTQIGRMVSRSADELHPEFPLDIYSANKTASE
jgi:UDP-glucose 4-epimerase